MSLKQITDAATLADAIRNQPQDVAESMQRIGRFGGKHPKSNVLIHSLEVYCRMPADSHNHARLFALLHDAHELITGDNPNPHKPLELEILQNQIDREVRLHLEIETTPYERHVVADIDAAHGAEEFAQWQATEYRCGHLTAPEQVSLFVRLLEELLP